MMVTVRPDTPPNIHVDTVGSKRILGDMVEIGFPGFLLHLLCPRPLGARQTCRCFCARSMGPEHVQHNNRCHMSAAYTLPAPKCCGVLPLPWTPGGPGHVPAHAARGGGFCEQFLRRVGGTVDLRCDYGVSTPEPGRRS